jgi:hypothetical protein
MSGFDAESGAPGAGDIGKEAFLGSTWKSEWGR